jgi:hypothetical protein
MHRAHHVALVLIIRVGDDLVMVIVLIASRR